MKTYELVVPCHFGLEAVLKREIYDLGYEISRVEDGRVSFQGDAEAVCRANIFLRTAERVLIEVGRFRATTFEELFQGIKALPWEDYIPVNGKFWVNNLWKNFKSTCGVALLQPSVLAYMKSIASCFVWSVTSSATL